MYDLFQGDGESAAYTAMVSAIARSEMLRASARMRVKTQMQESGMTPE